MRDDKSVEITGASFLPAFVKVHNGIKNGGRFSFLLLAGYKKIPSMSKRRFGSRGANANITSIITTKKQDRRT
jgi:hypothetical protein